MFQSDSQEKFSPLVDMITSRFLLEIPKEDREAALSARIFNHVCIGVTAFIVVAGFASLFVFARKTGTALTTLTLAILLCSAVSLARRRGVRAGGILLTMGLWVVFSLNLVLAGGVDSVTASIYIAIICVAGVLVGPSFALITAGLTVAFTLAVTYLQSLGYVLPNYYPMPFWSAWIVLLLPILLTIPAINGTIRAFFQAVRRANQEIETRKRTEAVLAESETRYRSLFEHDVSGVAVYNAVNDGEDFIFVDFNRAAERIDQVSRSELVGRRVLEAFPAVKEFGLFDVFQRVWRTGKPEALPVALYDDDRISGWRENYVYKLPTGEIIAVYSDETERKKAEESLSLRDELDHAITDISTCFINVNPDQLDEEINRELEELRTIAGADRSYVFCFTENKSIVDNTHEAVGAGITPQIDNLQGIDLDTELPWLAEQIRLGEIFFVPSVRNLPPEAPLEKKHFELQGIQSLLVVPIVYRSDLLGFLGFDSVREEKSWTDATESSLRLMGDILANAFARKEADASLRAKEEKLRRIIENINDLVYQTDMEGRLVFASQSSVDLLGYTPEEGLGRPISEFYAKPEERHRFLKLLMEKGTITNFEAEVVRKDGSHCWISTNATLLRDEKGSFIGVEGVARDITEQKRAQKALMRSEEKFRQIYTHAPWCYQSLDEQGHILDVNQAWLDLLGYSQDEVIGLPYRAFIHQHSVESFEKCFPRFKEDGRISHVEHTLVRNDGSLVHILIDGNIEYDEMGRFKRTHCTLIDITERKEMEHRLNSALVDLHASHEETNGYLEATRALLEGKGFESAARTIFDACKRLTGATAGYVALLSEDGSENEVLFLDAGGRECSVDPYLPMPIRGLREVAYRTGKAVYDNSFAESKWMEFMPDGHVTLDNVMFAPMIIEEKAVGLLGLANKSGGFADRDLKVSTAFAEYAAIGLKNAVAEQALTTSEERFRLAMESVQDGLWDWDMITNDVYRSPTFFSMLGYEDHEFPLGFEGWLDMVYPADKASILNALEEYIAGERADYEVEFRMFHKTGDSLWVLSRGEIVARDEDGKPLRMVGTHTDITERNNARQQLERSEALLKEAQKVAHIGHWELDDPSGTPTWSEEIFHIFGLDPAEGEPSFEAHRDIIHEEDWGVLDKAVRDLSVEGAPFDVEFRLLRPDGNIRWMNAKGYPTRNAEGEVVRLFGTAQDITDLKKAEEERQLLQSQLMQAQKVEALGTLTGGVAHDFNNLLTIINGYAEVLLSAKSEDDPDYPDLQKILETGLKGAELVQKLSSFSKKDKSAFQPLKLNQIVKDSVALMERTFPKMIEIETNLPEDLSTVNADASQLEQVLMNICVNAKEAMPDGGRLIIETGNVLVDEEYCRLRPGAKHGAHVLVEISDTGVGMSEETVDRIFDPFYSTKGWDFRKGTGLGLSVAKGIVEQHGGWITCESKRGEGTTFRVYFPAIEEVPTTEGTTIEPQPSPQDVKILLVDDEELVGALGKRILERAGYEVLTASNGKEALEVYSSELPNISLVILDLIMPRMGGEECLKKMLKINPHVRVVFSTGNPLSQNERDRLGRHAGGFVDKPYQVQRFLRVVEKVLGTKAAEGGMK